MKKFLVYIEDEEFQAKIFTKIISDQIRNSGVKIITFTKAKAAEEYLNSIKTDQVALALVDLSMYEVSGFDMIKKIKAINPRMIVAVLTSHEDKNIEIEARELGADDYFIKGKDVEELDRLRKFIIESVN